jgi:hypothetical protein
LLAPSVTRELIAGFATRATPATSAPAARAELTAGKWEMMAWSRLGARMTRLLMSWSVLATRDHRRLSGPDLYPG